MTQLSDVLVNTGTTDGDRTGDSGRVPFNKYNAAVQFLFPSVSALQAAIANLQGFVFTQQSPSTVWVIMHNLGRYPAITVVDTANNEIEGDVTYVNANTVQLSFTAAFSGIAYLN